MQLLECWGWFRWRNEAISLQYGKTLKSWKVNYLDARHLGKEYLADRFRQVYAELAKNNYFMEQDAIPIAPAVHYTIGGIKTDLWGRTTVSSLYACGEAAATGVHGANRLASNSLLEGIVFGRRTATYINGAFSATRKPSALSTGITEAIGSYTDLHVLRTKLDCVAGVVRQGAELEAMLKWLGASRGAHYRLDFPDKNDESFRKHTLQKWGRKAVME